MLRSFQRILDIYSSSFVLLLERLSMYIPLHYQVSEYDCVPTSFINAVCYLFERREVPPMVVRHISIYCLDTVGPSA